MKKKLICLLMCMALLFSMGTQIYAGEMEDNNEYAPEEYEMEGAPKVARWSYLSSASSNLTISGGKATASVVAQGYNNVDTMVVYTYLQKKVNGSWTNVTYTIDKVSGKFIAPYRTFSGQSSGYTYRIRARIYSYVGASYELATIYSNEKSY